MKIRTRSSAFLLILLTGCVAAAPPVATAPAPAPAAAATGAPMVPGGMQWLYGSGEGAVASIQTYRAFRDHALAAARNRPRDSVILASGATPAQPSFVPCGAKPLAVVLDVDETAILNIGYEYDEALKRRSYDPAIWDRWEKTGADKVLPLPGAVEALNAVRQAGIAVMFNTNRKAVNAAQTEAAINGVGLGPAKHRENLFLSGDDATGSEKDGRRARIADRYCVIAMAGDQLGDFSDHFNRKGLPVRERRMLASTGPIARLWGAGWFMFSNPVYGPSIRGGFDDVFPPETRWTDPGQ
ncbi:MAG TPA: HAD family acid phosphatase [Allosphingosinicella sp.]|nr:HAD family acid phosphatase [Allosphingosinicella sp.]